MILDSDFSVYNFAKLVEFFTCKGWLENAPYLS